MAMFDDRQDQKYHRPRRSQKSPDVWGLGMVFVWFCELEKGQLLVVEVGQNPLAAAAREHTDTMEFPADECPLARNSCWL